jgi:hypothetical protein
MSSPSAADPRAAWEHGLSPFVLKRLRLLIPSLADHYDRLYKVPPVQWGYVLAHYVLFQRLRRRENETEANHRARQALWLRARRAWERESRNHAHHDIRAAWPDSSSEPEIALGPWAPLGTWIASPDQIARSELENIVAISSSGRVLVLDIAADKRWLITRISELIDQEREAAGIAPAIRRGQKNRADKKRGSLELGEFLRKVRDYRIIQLWDLQLSGKAKGKTATARVLYPEQTKRPRNASRSGPRVLLQNLKRARELQDEVACWVARLLATE